jgi:hypothetical protein
MLGVVCMCVKRKYIISGLACLVAVVVTFRAYTVPPKAWSQIHIGDTTEQVRTKWPTVIQDLHDIKGDFCYRRLLLGHWRLWIIYGPGDRVLEKHCFLRLGTQNCFKDISFDD